MCRAAAANANPPQDTHAPFLPFKPSRHASLLRRLQSAQSIWQFSAVILPPLAHGVMWSACICSIENFLRKSIGESP